MSRRPLNGAVTITQAYGELDSVYRKGYHTGVDYAVGVGTPIYAPATGSVTSGDGRSSADGRGWFVIVYGNDGVSHHLYHLSSIVVGSGSVNEGQLVGYSGNTGMSTGPHLHWETRRAPHDNNSDFNPADWLFATPPTAVAPPVVSNSRVVTNPDGVNGRSAPNTSASIIKEYSNGEVLTFKGYVKGQDPYGNGNNIWFVGAYSQTYWYSGAFDNPSPTGLPEIIKEITPVTPPPVVTPTPTPIPVINPDIIDVTAADFPAWIQYNEVIDPDSTTTTNLEAYNYYKTKGVDYTYKPIESHTHWWGSPNAGSTHDGTVNYLKNTADLSVNFVTSANRITKMVPLPILAYTTGTRNPYAWKSENDPSLTEDGYKTLGALHYIVEKKNPRLANEPIRLHKEFTATACSEIDVAKVRDYANKFKTGELDIATGKPPVIIVTPPPTPVPTPTPDTVPTTEALSSAAKFVARVATQFAAAQVIVKGLCELAKQYDLCNLTSKQEGIAVIVATVLIIFGAQVAYKMNKSWKWIF